MELKATVFEGVPLACINFLVMCPHAAHDGNWCFRELGRRVAVLRNRKTLSTPFVPPVVPMVFSSDAGTSCTSHIHIRIARERRVSALHGGPFGELVTASHPQLEMFAS